MVLAVDCWTRAWRVWFRCWSRKVAPDPKADPKAGGPYPRCVDCGRRLERSWGGVVSDSLVKLRISVWRDFSPARALTLWIGDRPERQVISSDSDIQQEVFAWQMREDPFAGISDEADRSRLRALLFDRLEPSIPPEGRGIDRLNDFLKEATRILDADGSEWTVSLDPPIEDEDAPYRLNSLLALRNQVDWVAQVFGGLPGISVSVR